MSVILKKRITIIFGIYSTVITVAFIIFLTTNWTYVPKVDFGFADRLISPITFAFLGVLLSYYRPENRISWLMVLIAIMRQTSFLSTPADILFLKGNEATFWILIGNLWNTISGFTYTMLAYAIVLFPTGRLPSRRWRPINILLAAQGIITIGYLLFITFDLARSLALIRDAGGEIVLIPLVPSGPAAGINHVHEIPELNLASQILFASALSMVLLALFSQVSRYRTGTHVIRQQIKWVLFAVTVWSAALLLFLLPIGISFSSLIIISPLLPLAIAVAILRYRLFAIDLIIHRTAVYALLTGLLAIIYFGTVTLLQNLVSSVSDQESPLMIVLSTLLIAALFTPLRRRIQGFIDRRFYRQKYNTELTLAHFAETARDEVDLEALAAELTGIIHETLQPALVTLWLSSHRGEES